MRRLVSVMAAVVLGVGLVPVGPPASAAPTCPDPGEAIGGTVFTADPVVLGPLEAVTIDYEAIGRTACLDLHPASIRVLTPFRAIPVEPTSVREDRETGATIIRGTFTADASRLTNADAGEWVFEFAAGDLGFSYVPLNVLRQTTLSFDAAPEPLRRHHRLTFRGVLRAADWERDRYRGLAGQPLRVFAVDSQTTVPWVPLVEPTTGRSGRYRVRAQVPGPDRYRAVYLGTAGVASVTSRTDAVAARPAGG